MTHFPVSYAYLGQCARQQIEHFNGKFRIRGEIVAAKEREGVEILLHLYLRHPRGAIEELYECRRKKQSQRD